MRNLFLFIVILIGQQFYAQELDCKVTINAKNISGTNTQVFKTLEKSLNEFVNKTVWTKRKITPDERISCSMFITISAYSDNHFKASIQVQSSRPVYGSTYDTPVFNFKEKGFEFDYVEFDIIEFDKTTYTSNLIATLAFYSYIIIGLDSDTFALNGGATAFAKAQTIASQAQSQSDAKGWGVADGMTSKFQLIDELSSDTYEAFHRVMYNYHRMSLDVASEDPKRTKESLKTALMALKSIYDIRSDSLLLKVFFDTKTDEIVDFFSAGPKVPNKDLKLMLIKLSPYNAVKFQKIHY